MDFDAKKLLDHKALKEKSLGFHQEFKKFLFQGNVLSLAIGVIIGGAFGGFVSKVNADLIMPIINLFLPNGSWRTAGITIGHVPKLSPTTFKPILDPKTHQVMMEPVKLLIGDLANTFLTLIITGLVCFLIIKILVKPPPPPPPLPPPPPTKTCAFCLDTIPAAATKCRSCGSQQPAAGA
ncbi:MAG: MscL family protein [Phycisphaerae bacterium]